MQKASNSSLKILHRIYFGFDGKPDPYIGYLKTWQEKLPDFEIRHWNADNLPIAACHFSRMMYELRDHAFLSDYFRWWVLREHGGVYLDADIEIVNGIIFRNLVEELEVKKKNLQADGIQAIQWQPMPAVHCPVLCVRSTRGLVQFRCGAGKSSISCHHN